MGEKNEQMSLDLYVWTGRVIRLKVDGINSIHVLGHWEKEQIRKKQKLNVDQRTP